MPVTQPKLMNMWSYTAGAFFFSEPILVVGGTVLDTLGKKAPRRELDIPLTNETNSWTVFLQSLNTKNSTMTANITVPAENSRARFMVKYD